MTQRSKRSPEESIDNMARFFEHVASAVKETGGVFVDDDLTAGEARSVFLICKKQARELRAKAEKLRRTVREE